MKNTTFYNKFKIFFQKMDCILQCISDDTEIEKDKILDINEEIFAIKKNNQIIYLIGRESIKI
tara:strand:- start:63 stop:251 length:189 start_codon:yes stop_codon:yes gene_type:complete